MAKVKPARPIINREHPLARGLVGAWPFMEGGGAVIRDLGPGRAHFSAINSPTWGMSPYGRRLAFVTASAQYLRAAANPILNSARGLTIATWVNRTAATPSWLFLGEKYDGATYTYQLGWENSGAGNNIRAILTFTGPTQVSWTTTAAFSQTNVWMHIAMTYDGQFVRIFVDGKLIQEWAETRQILANNGPLDVGASTNGTTHLAAAQIADYRLWDRGLSVAEIRALYSDPWALYRTKRAAWPIGTAFAPQPVTVTPAVVNATLAVLAPTVDNGAGTVVTPAAVAMTLAVPAPIFAGSLPVAPFFSDYAPEDDSTRVGLGDEVSVVATPPDPTGNPVATAGPYAPVATVNGVSHAITITSLSGGAKRLTLSPVALAGKTMSVSLTAYEVDGTPHVASWSYTYRPAYEAVAAPLSVTVRPPSAVDAPLTLTTRVPAAFDAPLQLTVIAPGVLEAYGMPAQYTVLDVASGLLGAYPVGVHYRAVDRLREAALYAGAVVAEWYGDRVAFGAAVEGTRRALVALAATLTGPERQTALYLAAQVHTEHRETVAALGATLAEWGQEGVPLGADAQKVTRKLLYTARLITQREQAIRSDTD